MKQINWFYVRDEKKYWRIGIRGNKEDLRESLREDLKNAEIITEDEFDGRK